MMLTVVVAGVPALTPRGRGSIGKPSSTLSLSSSSTSWTAVKLIVVDRVTPFEHRDPIHEIVSLDRPALRGILLCSIWCRNPRPRSGSPAPSPYRPPGPSYAAAPNITVTSSSVTLTATPPFEMLL